MVNELIAIIGIFIVLNGFIIVLLNKVSLNLKSQAKRSFVNKLNVFDELIDTKLSEIRSLEDRLKELEDKTSIPERASSLNVLSNYYYPTVADYKDLSFFDNYKFLKDNFNLDYKSILNIFIENVLDNNHNVNGIYFKINEKLNFDVKYELMIKREEEQLNMLKSILDSKEYKILEHFMSNNKFDVLEFIRYVKNQMVFNDEKVVVRISNDLLGLSKMDNRISFIVDNEILEGLKIIYKNKVYDYSFGRINE